MQDYLGPQRTDIADMNLFETSLVLQRNRTTIYVIHYSMALVFILWLLATGIPGFNLYDGAPGTVSSYSHSMWWLVIQFIVLLMGQSALRFDLDYVSGSGLEKGIGDVMITIWWYRAFCVAAILSFVAHAVLMGLEQSSCTSTLCSTQLWAFGVTLAFICLHPILLALQAFRVTVYKRNLEAAIVFLKVDLLVIPDTGDEETPITSSIVTPLLKKHREKKQVGRHGFGHKMK
jgi:hypothetical protein